MAIGGWNGTGSIKGKSPTDKLNTLARQIETETDGASVVYKVRNTLNSYLSNYKYSYYAGNTLDLQRFRIYTFNSLAFDRAPILHARTEELSYYNGHESGHYITVTEMNYNTMKVRLHDPNYNNQYYGIHFVPYTEAYDSIHRPDETRYLICHWPE